MSTRGFDPRIWLLAIGTFAAGTDSFVIAGILPELAKSFGVTISTAGTMVSGYALVYGIGTPVLAVIVARWRQDRVALASLLAFVVINLACAVAPSFIFLLLMRVGAAMCAAVYAPSAYALATSFARPEKRGAALAAVALGSSGSTVLGVPLGTYVGQNFGWHATFVMVAAMTVVGIVALFWGGPRAAITPDLATASLRSRIAPLGRGRIWLMLAPVILLFCAIYVVYTYIVPLLETRYLPGQVPLFLTIYGLGGLAGSQIGGKLVDTFGAVRPLVTVLVLFALFQFVFPFSLGSEIATGFVMFAITICSWGCFAPIQSRALSAEPEHANVVFALINSSVFLGGALGAAFGGVLYGLVPVTDLPFAAAALTVAAVTIILTDIVRARPRH